MIVVSINGFFDAWELRKLGEIVERVTRKNKNLESSLPLTISAQYGLIDQNDFFNKIVASRDVSGYYLVKNGEFAYNKSYSSGYPLDAIKRLDRYDMGVLSTLYIVFKPIKIDSEFLAKYYDTTYWHREVSKHAAEGARNHGLLNIAASNFFETELKFPIETEEQVQIGSFFKSLDETIALHQRKLDILKQMKKGFLQQLFPENEEKVPGVRFADFDEEWAMCKLGASVENIGTGSSSFSSGVLKSGTTPYEVLGSTSVISYDNDFDYSGDFVLTARVGANAGKLYKHSGDVKISDNTVYIQSSELDFIFSLLDRSDLKRLSFGTGQPLIKASELKNLILAFPTNRKEKAKIGKFFSKFDDTIALHQQKLDQLKTLKKAYLRNMFI
ncbi:restriction endonuclease subunit S [Listeria rocourtiae]|nr:restriction endonuclease subunit S [Listeria rocourtiae]